MATSELDEGVHAWLRRERELRAAHEPPATASVAERRTFARWLSDELALVGTEPVHPHAVVTEIAMPGVDGGTFARMYAPADAEGPLPTQLYLHGGGFMHGSARERVDDGLVSARAVATGMRFVSYEYALAPEHPYPAARDEIVDALAHLRTHADALGIDATRIGVGGVSAGASLAASASLAIVRGGGTPPWHVSLEVPAVSVAALEAEVAGASDAVAAQLAEYPALLEAYAPAVVRDDLAFVADADDLHGFPPTLVVAASDDVLRSGAELLATRLADAGVAVAAHTLGPHIHASPGLTALSPAARAWQRLVADELRHAYGTHHSATAPTMHMEERR